MTTAGTGPRTSGSWTPAGFLTSPTARRTSSSAGGENISAVEVEEQLMTMAGVAEVAVVAAPHPRLGEQVCAFVRLAPGADPLDLDAVRTAPGRRRPGPSEVARAAAPIGELPRTPSGKVKKEELRRRLRDADPPAPSPAGPPRP